MTAIDDAPTEPATAYEKARQLALRGAWQEAESVTASALIADPENPDLHRLAAEIAHTYYADFNRLDALEGAAMHAYRAFTLALENASIDYRAAELIADSAAALPVPLDAVSNAFTRAEAYDNSGRIAEAYARTLIAVGAPGAETAFRRAAAVATAGNTETAEAYAEWLLDRGRASDAFDVLARFDTPETNTYVAFLRGVALERLGDTGAAANEYARYTDFSTLYPAPARFRIAGSAAQSAAQIRFEDDRHVASASVTHAGVLSVTTSQAVQGLAYLIQGEAGTELVGSKRAEGWVVRNRALRGSIYGSDGLSCPYVTNGGATIADQYTNVMCQGSGAQFNGMCIAWCSNPNTTTCKLASADSASAASDVYNGKAPDPVGMHCPGGFAVFGAMCDPATRCYGGQDSYRLRGGVFNWATGVGVPCPARCSSTSVGKTCGNGSSDNCFYSNANYARSGVVTYSVTFTASGQVGLSPSFSAGAGTQTAHLEGPEDQTNPDFDLSLQKSASSGWVDVARSARAGTVEDLKYSSSASGTYRWRIASMRGTGSAQLYTVRQ
ncbi:MAG: hypothetical protein JO093_01220 [Acidobacteria bacterium]|nr:hypothetical protein [Acidobacteriota bacterium]MBV9184203.1 hypothetical protein [Acidobacteriota bacterium]